MIHQGESFSKEARLQFWEKTALLGGTPLKGFLGTPGPGARQKGTKGVKAQRHPDSNYDQGSSKGNHPGDSIDLPQNCTQKPDFKKKATVFPQEKD